MANEKNLRSIGSLTTNEQRIITSKGGKASAKKRAERKALKEELLLLLGSNDYNRKISLALIKEALNGNVKAFNTIRDTIGEKPKDNFEIGQDKPFEVNIKIIK